MRNYNLLTQIPGELENAIKCRCNQSFTLGDIANTLQHVRKRTNIGKSSPYRGNSFKEKQPYRLENEDKPKIADAKNKANSIEQVPEEESPTEDSGSDSMSDAIREPSDVEQDPKEEFLVEYQEETQLEIQDIQLEAGMPQDNANKNLCKHTQNAQTFLGTPTRGMAYIYETATKMTVCVNNAQHPLFLESGAYLLIVAKYHLDNHLPNWEKKLFPTKAMNLKVY
ncbi:hypothetical protein O181_006558 [Austropuccinia psidii MF-1]|uniref:Uncharacterized protein n=1 Tax=Austropuccinia psidii MF-1 TaxID=1389203 RepID=A0A9Q3BKQ1_9BASI|nr:hypothetical protein [Austropuccinia psidii MF-1]